MKHTETQCAGHKCARPVVDTTICGECEAALTQALRWLLPDVRRADREPTLDPQGRIVRNSFGRYQSLPWDTPSGEARNLPRILDEQSAKLAVRRGLATGHTPHAEPPLPVDLRAVDTAGRIRAVVATYATLTSGHPAPLDGYWDVAAVAAWLLDQLPHIRLQDWAGNMHRDVTRVVARAERSVDAPVGRSYLGPCSLDQSGCQGSVVSVGNRPPTCGECGRLVDPMERRSELKDQARGLWLTAREIDEMSAAIDGPAGRIPKSNVTSWHERGLIRGVRGRPSDADPVDVSDLSEVDLERLSKIPMRFLYGEVQDQAEKVPHRARRKTA